MRETWECRACNQRWTRAPEELLGCPSCGSPDTFAHASGCVAQLVDLAGTFRDVLVSLIGIVVTAMRTPRTLLKIVVLVVGTALVALAHVIHHGGIHILLGN